MLISWCYNYIIVLLSDGRFLRSESLLLRDIMEGKMLSKRVVTCKMKHLQNICKNVLEPREVDGSKHFCKCFILDVTTVCLQAVFDPAYCNIFANVLA